jgi:3-oxoacyl-[acyl-carrier-protein] synthase II
VDRERIILRRTGLATPLGGSLSETWRAVLAGQTTADLGRVPIDSVSEVTRVEQLALRAIEDAGIDGRVDGLVVATSKGNVEAWMQAHHSPLTDSASADASWGLADLAATIARKLRLPAGPRLTLSAACASGLHAIIRAKLLIEAGEADRVLVVAAESSLHGLFTHTFRRLGALAKPGTSARPFDRNRDGFVMSEAAACVLLERATPCRGNVVLGRCAVAADASHLTNVDPSGETTRWLLSRVAADSSVDLVHAHATGTGADEVELRAIEATLAGRPVVFSHKAALGHSLGAAGLCSAALSVAMHQHGVVPPNVNTVAPIEVDGARLVLSRESVRRTIQRSVCLASGFGGACAAIELETIT